MYFNCCFICSLKYFRWHNILKNNEIKSFIESSLKRKYRWYNILKNNEIKFSIQIDVWGCDAFPRHRLHLAHDSTTHLGTGRDRIGRAKFGDTSQWRLVTSRWYRYGCPGRGDSLGTGTAGRGVGRARTSDPHTVRSAMCSCLLRGLTVAPSCVPSSKTVSPPLIAGFFFRIVCFLVKLNRFLRNSCIVFMRNFCVPK
jgi:hypothetical protein